MCSKLLKSVQSQRLLMNDFKALITTIIDGVNANIETVADLVDPDIGPEMINI